MTENKISIGTIARTIAVIIVITNMILKAAGKPIIDVDEGTVLYWLEYIIEIAIIVVAWWKNNSISPAAIKADEFLKQLRNDELESEVE